ncbi:hypothetical protein V1524DRAFT_410843 [Lipomyces starkeyi]
MYPLFLLTALLNLAVLCSADFHVSAVVSGSVGYCSNDGGCQDNYNNYVIACPSNYWNCNCFTENDRGAQADNGNIKDIVGSSFFQLDAGLCGMGALNFYQQGDGSWQFYVDGGDGTLQGTCYSNSASDYCWNVVGSASVADRLVCYSYICN